MASVWARVVLVRLVLLVLVRPVLVRLVLLAPSPLLLLVLLLLLAASAPCSARRCSRVIAFCARRSLDTAAYERPKERLLSACTTAANVHGVWRDAVREPL